MVDIKEGFEGTVTGTAEFETEEAAFASRTKDKSKLKYSEQFAFRGPVRFKIESYTPVMISGKLACEVRATIEDAYLPATEQGKLLVTAVPYGKTEMSNGKPRDTLLYSFAKSTGVADTTAFENESYTTLLGACGDYCHGVIGVNNKGYDWITRWLTPAAYEQQVAAGLQVKAPPRAAKTAANGATTTSEMPAAGEVPAGM